ncbi:hypothetical protein BG004_005726 [Podila humilis]|nr:hypothetical protein BG004_005726 [Podila humilis]
MTVHIGAQSEYLNGHFHTHSANSHTDNNSHHHHQYTSPQQHHQLHHQQGQQQQHQQQYDQPSTKELAITSSATRGTPPPPLMGSAIVLVNDSALHCFGGRLENRELTNCHYVLDVETGLWETIEPAPAAPSNTCSTTASLTNNTTRSSSSSSSSSPAAYAPEAISSGAHDENDAISAGTTSKTYPSGLLSLSLTTDPVNTNSGSLSGSLSISPQPRYFHTLNSFGTQIILFGGMGKIPVEEEEEEGVQRNSDAEEDIDYLENKNQNGHEGDKAPPKQQKQKAKMTVLAALNDLHVYDITTQRWEQKHPPLNSFTPQPRWAHVATIMDHYLVVIGGTDTDKNYVEDACVLDLDLWEWVANVPNIGQCGSYRTIAATGPSKMSSSSLTPSLPSFPSINASSSPQTSSNLGWVVNGSGGGGDPVDTVASISQVLSGRIAARSTNTTWPSSQDQDDYAATNTVNNSTFTHAKKSPSERLMSSELTPSFKTGKDDPSIYLYSNYNFQNLQRELKVITPHYSTYPVSQEENAAASLLSTFGPPSFSLVEKSQALSMMGHELPLGLRFPQGHVFQNQLIVTGTLIAPGKAPTLAIYSFNLASYTWERLETDRKLEVGSWNRTLLHPATGTLLIFGKYESNAEVDYANRIQHHDHLMMINLQAYGLYERPVPSLPHGAQELGYELLNEIGLNDMHVASVTGTLFGANSTVLAARWPEFASLLLSPPYVTPLILELSVPDDVVPPFLQYLYTGGLPQAQAVTAGMADYLLILARRYDLNGLYALTMDILHQNVGHNSMRVHTTALLAGELGLSARAISLALKTLPKSRAPSIPVSEMVQSVKRLSRTYSGRTPTAPAPPLPPAATRPLYPPERRRGSSTTGTMVDAGIAARDSIGTDGGYHIEHILQQYRPPAMIQEGEEDNSAGVQSDVAGGSSRQRKMRSPPLAPISSFRYASSGGHASPLNSPGHGHGVGQQFAASQYPSPLSPSFQPHPFMSQPIPSAYNGFSDDEGTSTAATQEQRLAAAKKRLQMQQYAELDTKLLQQQQQLLLEEQQRLRNEEMLLAEQHHQQQQIFMQKQMLLKQQQKEISEHAVLGALEYHFGGSSHHHGQGGSSSNKLQHKHQHHSASIVDTITSQKSNGSKNSHGSSGKENNSGVSSSNSNLKDKDKNKGLFTKMKPPKSKVSGADLMKSAGF